MKKEIKDFLNSQPFVSSVLFWLGSSIIGAGIVMSTPVQNKIQWIILLGISWTALIWFQTYLKYLVSIGE